MPLSTDEMLRVLAGQRGHTTPKMANRLRIICKHLGLLTEFTEALEGKSDFHARLQLPHYMPLVLEIQRPGCRDHNFPHVILSHFYMQEGDVMNDPLVDFAALPDDRWIPLSWEMSGLGLYREFLTEPGRYMKKLLMETASFCNTTWQTNLLHQGWCDRSTLDPECRAAEKRAALVASSPVSEPEHSAPLAIADPHSPKFQLPDFLR